MGEKICRLNELLPLPNAIATAILVLLGIMGYCDATREPELQIEFRQKQVKEIAPLTLPNSQRIYDLNPAYTSPPTDVLNEVVISNKSSVKASDVSVILKIEKGPFIFSLVSFDQTLQPRGTWEVIPDTETYRLIKLRLGTITSSKPSRFFLVFSFPSSLDITGKDVEEKALYVFADTQLQKNPAEARYDIRYWK
jgi:hypothetical protein